jgi:hypothetical protein
MRYLGVVDGVLHGLRWVFAGGDTVGADDHAEVAQPEPEIVAAPGSAIRVVVPSVGLVAVGLRTASSVAAPAVVRPCLSLVRSLQNGSAARRAGLLSLQPAAQAGKVEDVSTG